MIYFIKFLFFYQSYNILKYFTVANISILYFVKYNSITKSGLSNIEHIINVIKLFTYPPENVLLDHSHTCSFSNDN